MDIKYFEYVLTIVELESINKVANYLYISQPNLSVSIKKLEKELGFKIFERNKMGIKLTKEGEIFVESAKKIKRELEIINDIPNMIKYKDNISLSCTYSFDIMNTFIKFKHHNSPSTDEDLFKETGLIQAISDLIEQRYRIIIFYCFDKFAKQYYYYAKKYNLNISPVAKDCPFILVASKSHLVAKREFVDFAEIKNFKFIMYENFKFEEWLGFLGFENENKIFYTFDRGGLIEAVTQSNYVTVMMKRYTEVYSNDFVEIPIINAPCGMSAYMMYHKNYLPNKREKMFIKELKKLFTK